MSKKITRIGVYGVVVEDGKILLIRQNRGPYAGKYDFPGGGMEFGETPEEALRREFAEELAMEFDSVRLLDNLTATLEVDGRDSNDSYLFYQIGLIYCVKGRRLLKDVQSPEFAGMWIDLATLTEEMCSKLLWAYKSAQGL